MHEFRKTSRQFSGLVTDYKRYKAVRFVYSSYFAVKLGTLQLKTQFLLKSPTVIGKLLTSSS